MVVDASVWVSALLAQDVHHLRSRQWLSRHLAVNGTVILPTLALAEVAGAISRRASAELGRRSIDHLVHLRGLLLAPLGGPSGVEAADIAAALRLRGGDAVYVQVAQSFQVPLVSLDEELLAKAAMLIEVLRP